MKTVEPGRKRTPMGPWRLLDLVCAATPWRGGLLAGATILPEHGLPDPKLPDIDPEAELPESNIAEHEQQAAIARERARRVFGIVSVGGR